jgi:hypothetical protein
MVTIETARQIALSFAGTDEYPHFDKYAFRANKRVFATLWEVDQRMMVKLSLVDQSVFTAFNPAIIYPVPNKWGLQGCTFFELKDIRQDILTDALTTAWQAVTANKSTQKSQSK